MNDVLVKIYVPKIGEQYDIWLPINKKIYNVIVLLVKAIGELTKGYYAPQKFPYLYDKETTNVYDINTRVIDTNIRNGSELILI